MLLVRGSTLRALAALAAFALATIVGLTWTRPPTPRPASAPAAELSAERAFAHVTAIAERPHRIGSADHARVRAYIVEQLRALGLSPEIQEAIAGRGNRLALVRNIVARRPGSAGSGAALLLVCHYDSRSMTPGAADDGLGVAALLEALRALDAGPRPERDVIALFTDAEEEGLFGARAFVDEHRWAADVGLAINFEARGNAGPAHVFQTSDRDGALVRTIARAVAAPAASSLSQAVYRLMPNDTDLSVFLPRTPSINIANIGGLARYHAPTDTPGNLDRGTLQHHGDLALALTRAFASGALPPPAEPDAVYFDAGPVFVHYPGSWSTPLAVAAAILLVVFVAIGVRSRALRPGAALLGFVVALIVAIGAAGTAMLLYWVGAALHPSYAAIAAARPALGHLYLGAFLAVAATLALFAQRLLARHLRTAELFAGAAALFAALALVAARALPGASFLFAWPAILSLLAGLAVLRAGGFDSDAPRAVALQIAAPLPAILLVAPFVTQLFDAFGLAVAPAPPLLAALLFSLAAPLTRHLRPLAPAALAAAAISFVAALVLPPFDAGHPAPDTLFFAVDADTGRGAWVTPDRAPDRWSSNVLRAGATRVPLPLPFPIDGAASVIARDVGPVREPAPTLTWTSSDTVLVAPPPGAEVLAVSIDGPVASVRVAGRTVGRSFRFYAPPPEGLSLKLGVGGLGPITVRALSQRPGFPDTTPAPGPRPPELMAKPGMLPPWDDLLESDMTLVARTSTR